MNLWKDRRVDSLHRVVLPREAFSLLGWTSDEVLEAEALLAQDALLWIARLFEYAVRQNRQPKTDVFLRQRAFGGTLFYCVVSLYCIAFSAKVLFTITSCGAVFSSSPAAVITVCSKSKLSCVSTGSVLYAPMSL